MPERYREFWNAWRRLHPEWQLRTWTDHTLPDLVNQAVYDDIPNHARSAGVAMSRERAIAVQRADIVAYELLDLFGGVYVNCDVRPLRSFEPLRKHAAFIGMEDSYHICNAVMGAEPGHALMRDVIAALPKRYDAFKHVGMEPATGPMFLTEVWRSGTYDICVLSQKAFYPVHFSELPWGEDSSERVYQIAKDTNAYAVHSWGHRWQEGDPIR